MATPNNTRAPNLFWRTFILMMLLIVFCVMGWLQSFRVLNETPYAIGAARQIVTMANLTRYALISADPFYRPDLLMVLASREGLRILPKESTDVAMPLSSDVGSPWSVADIENYVHTQLGQRRARPVGFDFDRRRRILADEQSHAHQSQLRYDMDMVGSCFSCSIHFGRHGTHKASDRSLKQTVSGRACVRPRHDARQSPRRKRAHRTA